jgi:hypothetical protein
MTAQDCRAALSRRGFVPICRMIEGAEHWGNGPRRVILHWPGDDPEAVDLERAYFATFRRMKRGRVVMTLCPDKF